jgi:Ca2+/H+ antiporter, TMEM165/GDT1 family
MYNNKRFWFRRGLMFFILFIAGILLFSFIVMSLWNAILPGVLHVSNITFAQALGILVLSKILFGGFRGGWRGRHGRMHYMQQKLAAMTPEEREKFKAEWRNRCGRWGNRSFESKPSESASAATE